MTLTKARLKELGQLTRKKERDGKKEFLIEGVRLVQEVVDSDFAVLEAYYTPDFPTRPEGKALLQRLGKKTNGLQQITRRQLETVSDTVTSQGVLAIVRQKQHTVESLLRTENPSIVLVAFDGVSDPGNLGSMIRTCDWFGVHGILLGTNSVELYNPKVLRATMGGIFHLPVAEGVDLLSAISKARSLGYTVYATDPSGETHFDRVRYAGKSLIVFGNEAWGVSDQVKQLTDVRLAIRRYGSGESLNVGVACGIILSCLHRLSDE